MKDLPPKSQEEDGEGRQEIISDEEVRPESEAGQKTEQQPIAANNTPENRAKNRRVDIRLKKKDT